MVLPELLSRRAPSWVESLVESRVSCLPDFRRQHQVLAAERYSLLARCQNQESDSASNLDGEVPRCLD